MAYEPIPREFGDVNLDNYYLDHQTYNTSVYVHKKFLPKNKFQRKYYLDSEINCDFVKPTQEKCQQFDIEYDIQRASSERKKVKNNLHDDSLLAQTVKFAKDLAPKIIPPSREFSPTPVVYTVKASKKSGKKISKLSSPRSENDSMPDIHKSKDTRCTKKNKSYVHYSKEDVSHSTHDNTSDDFQTNQSSSLSLSEVLENNLNKTTQNRKRKQEFESKIETSNCLEGIATEIDNKNRDIKVHVMNESERNMFYESITVPIVNTIKEYLNKVKNPTGIAAEMETISQALASNMEKLDYVIHTLEKIERKISDYSEQKKTKVIMSPKPISSKASRLEELAEDMPEIREVNSTEEDEYEAPVCKKVITSRSEVVSMNPNYDYGSNRMADNYDHGENGRVQMNVTSSQVGTQERPNRIPARFCWTDGSRNN